MVMMGGYSRGTGSNNKNIHDPGCWRCIIVFFEGWFRRAKVTWLNLRWNCGENTVIPVITLGLVVIFCSGATQLPSVMMLYYWVGITSQMLPEAPRAPICFSFFCSGTLNMWADVGGQRSLHGDGGAASVPQHRTHSNRCYQSVFVLIKKKKNAPAFFFFFSSSKNTPTPIGTRAQAVFSLVPGERGAKFTSGHTSISVASLLRQGSGRPSPSSSISLRQQELTSICSLWRFYANTSAEVSRR